DRRLADDPAKVVEGRQAPVREAHAPGPREIQGSSGSETIFGPARRHPAMPLLAGPPASSTSCGRIRPVLRSSEHDRRRLLPPPAIRIAARSPVNFGPGRGGLAGREEAAPGSEHGGKSGRRRPGSAPTSGNGPPGQARAGSLATASGPARALRGRERGRL